MAKRDFYDVLGVDKGADASTIKSAYRKLAMKHHPDRNPDNKDAEEKFREATEAYDVLKDDQKRAAYDQFGHAAFDGNGGGRPGGGGFSGFSAGGFSDIFDEMFSDFMGGGRRQRRGQQSRKGSDLRYDLAVTLEQAFEGDTQKITIPVPASCESCGGSGAAKGSKPTTCSSCDGHGKIRAQQGFFSVERTCPTCQGQGEVISQPCTSCGGQGRIQKNKSLNVNIPKGVDTGTRIRLSGEGEAGLRGGPAGDLYIFIEVAPHEIFQREGTNLFCRVPVSMAAAALGGDIEVPTIDGGRSRVKVPAGSQSGRQMRLRSKGMPAINS
ncbi:MAG: molecular chaperone DnaJ, partial [Alphaproteobacteria bacterium]|nr:molecular chaperone DnaJ [Alphaproteobacteria bacterium]